MTVETITYACIGIKQTEHKTVFEEKLQMTNSNTGGHTRNTITANTITYDKFYLGTVAKSISWLTASDKHLIVGYVSDTLRVKGLISPRLALSYNVSLVLQPDLQ